MIHVILQMIVFFAFFHTFEIFTMKQMNIILNNPNIIPFSNQDICTIMEIMSDIESNIINYIWIIAIFFIMCSVCRVYTWYTCIYVRYHSYNNKSNSMGVYSGDCNNYFCLCLPVMLLFPLFFFCETVVFSFFCLFFCLPTV